MTAGESGTYKNYVFDLYGTLVDISTDERGRALWRRMAELYSSVGAVYSAPKIEQAYLRICADEEQKLRRRTGYAYPEIELENTFIRLLYEAPKGKCVLPKEAVHEWICLAANTFRAASRKKLVNYKNTVSVLSKLKENGGRMFLLSNAQRIFTMNELKLMGLTAFFEDIFISSDHGIKKPQKEFLLKLIEKHSLDPAETVMIGNDVLSDMKIADECGVDGILLNTFRESGETIRGKMEACSIKHPESIKVICSGDIAEALSMNPGSK